MTIAQFIHIAVGIALIIGALKQLSPYIKRLWIASAKLNVLFLALFCISVFAIGAGELREVKRAINLRDLGERTVATVVRHEARRTKYGEDYFIDYEFTTTGSGRKYQGGNRVREDTYKEFPLGAKIPIRFDRANPTFSNTNVHCCSTNLEMYEQATFVMLLSPLLVGLALLPEWMLVAWVLKRIHEERAADNTTDTSGAAVRSA